MAENSWAGAASELIKALGSATPYFVIVLMAGWGFLEFQKLEQAKLEVIQNAQKEAQNQYGKQIEELNKNIRESYKDVSDISSKQIKNVRDLITLYDDVKKKVDGLQKETEDHAKKAKLAGDQMDSLLAVKTRTEKELKELQDALVENRIKLQNIEEKRNKKSQSLRESVDEIADLRQKIRDLALQVRNDYRSDSTRSISLAEKYLTEVTGDIVNLLTELRTDAGRSFDSVAKLLIGTSMNEIRPVIEKGVGYKLWLGSSSSRSASQQPQGVGDGEIEYVGVGEIDGKMLRNVVQLKANNDRVEAVVVRDYWIGFQIPKENNWLDFDGMVVSFGQSGANFYYADELEEHWHISTKLIFGTFFVEPIFGDDIYVKYFEFDEFANRFPDLLAYFHETDIRAIASKKPYLNFAMIRNADKFDTRTLYIPDFDEFDELFDSFSEIALAAVQRNPDSVSELLSGSVAPDMLGLLGAIVLQPEFKVQAVGKPKAKLTEQPTAQSGSGDRVIVEVRASFAKIDTITNDPVDQSVVFQFEKKQEGAPWQLRHVEGQVDIVSWQTSTSRSFKIN